MGQVSGIRRSRHLRPRLSRKIGVAVALLLTIVAGLVFTMSPPAYAAAPTTAITDYDNYPNNLGLVPDGCTATGSAVLTGQSYVKNGDGANAQTSLANLSLLPGDVITMTWTGFAEGCDGIGVALSAKKTQHNFFAPFTNQALVSHEYCGPGGDSCGSDGSFGPLTLTVPSTQTACNFQLDATIGPPLDVVGPLGSYYTNLTRGANDKPFGTADDPNMLISAIVGGQGSCFEPPTATAVASCTAADNGPGFDLSIANNDDDEDAIVDVLKGDTVVNDDLAVPFPQPPAPLPNIVQVLVPFSEGETDTITVIDVANDAVIFTDEFTANCTEPGATITQSCVAGGTVIAFTNTGENSVTFTVTKDGTTIDTVTVGGDDTESETYPMDEDTTATFRVTAGDFDSGDVPITHDCVEAQQTTTTTTPDEVLPDVVEAEELARTGAGSTMGVTTAAGLLLMVGGLLLALANRPLPATAYATRSRGNTR